MTVDVVGVGLIALATALATGLGVFPVMRMHVDKERSVVITSALAAGSMLGASVGLFYEGSSGSVFKTFLGALVGVVLVFSARGLMGQRDSATFGALKGARGVTASLIVGVMTVHSFTEGAAVGVSFAGKESLGLVISAAIAIHNIPEGVAISLAMMPFGVPARKAAFWSIFSSLPQPLMAVPAYLAVRSFEPLLPVGLGFAGGAMTWIVITHLLPEALASKSRSLALLSLLGSAVLMLAIEFAVGL